ncbi:hypothetical protein ACU686_09370 [Yinghuangia aomiensis]
MFGTGSRDRVCDFRVAGQQVGQRAHVGSTLDVVLAAQRVDPVPAFRADRAAEDCQIGEGAHPVGAVQVLRDPQPVDDRRPFGQPVHPGRRDDQIGRNAGDVGDAFWWVVGQKPGEFR